MADDVAQPIPYPALGDLVQWLNTKAVPYTIIGGLSVSIISQPRITIDVDLVVWLDPDEWADFLQSAEPYGIYPRKSDALEFARERRVLLMQHGMTGIGIDISFGALPFEKEMIDRSKMVTLEKVTLRVATPEDVIIMKIVAHRAQDIRDILNIMRVCSQLDVKRIRYWVHEFALVLENPELDVEISKLINDYVEKGRTT